MKKILILSAIVYTSVFSVNIPQRFDDVTNLSNKLFLSVLDQAVEFESEEYKSLPPSISFFSADAKFDGEHLKFCEIGNGLYGVPVPAYALLNDRKSVLYPPYWEFLWLHAVEFGVPVWCIKYPKAHTAHKTLNKLGGKTFDSIEEFEKFFQENYFDSGLSGPQTIQGATGILAYAGTRISGDKLEEFKQRHPSIIFVNDFPDLYARRKDKIHEVFYQDDFLKQFRPKWGVYSVKYTQNLANQVIQDIGSDLYVIKPIGGRQAKGVTLVDKNNLDSILKTILKNVGKNKKNKGQTFDWKSYGFDKFIVEEFVESKIVERDGKAYDPTLRLGFILIQNKGKITVNVINAFWKFPPKSLNEKCELMAKHITKPMVGAHDPAMNVDAQDMFKIREILYGMLPRLYAKMATR